MNDIDVKKLYSVMLFISLDGFDNITIDGEDLKTLRKFCKFFINNYFTKDNKLI